MKTNMFSQKQHAHDSFDYMWFGQSKRQKKNYGKFHKKKKMKKSGQANETKSNDEETRNQYGVRDAIFGKISFV